MPKSIKNLLEPFFQSKHVDWKIKLLSEWKTIMGSLAQHTSIVKIYDTTLILGVYDSCWLQELYLLSPELLTTINKSLDHPRIKNIRLQYIGKKKGKSLVSHNHISKEILPPIRLSSREKVALNRVKNEHLRRALYSFLLRCHREKLL